MTAESSRSKMHLHQRLESLKSRLMGFAVKNQQGNFLGEVHDVVIDAKQHLNLVIASSHFPRSVLLRSKFIEHVEPKERSLFTALNASDFNQLPEYSMQPRPVDPAAFPDVQNDPQQFSSRQSMPVPDESSDRAIDASPKAIEADLDNFRVEDIVQEEVIQLLEERLNVGYQKRKVGEIIVRKEIETHLIEVPVRREKLIVEEVGNTSRQLAVIDLGQSAIDDTITLKQAANGAKPIGNGSDQNELVQGEFTSLRSAAWLLDAIAKHDATDSRHSTRRIHITIEVSDPREAELYRNWFDRTSISKSSS